MKTLFTGLALLVLSSPSFAAPCKVAIQDQHLLSLIGYGDGEHRPEDVINHALSKKGWILTTNPEEADAKVTKVEYFNDLIKPSLIGPRAKGTIAVELQALESSVTLSATKYFTMPTFLSGGCGNDYLDPAILKAGRSILRQLKRNLPHCS